MMCVYRDCYYPSASVGGSVFFCSISSCALFVYSVHSNFQPLWISKSSSILYAQTAIGGIHTKRGSSNNLKCLLLLTPFQLQMFTSKEKRTRWLMENKPLRDLKHLHQVGVIGNGTFGQVIRAMDSDNKVEVAVKRVKQDHLDFPVTALREISLLQILRHENIVNLMEVCIDEQCLYIVLEYADHDLAGLISSKDMELTSTHIKVFMKQLLQGIDFIHRCFVLHRDLKPANILVNKRGVLKIADWGMAKSLEKLPTQLTPQLVTLWYRAPEMLLGCESYGTAVDMWSIGIIFADMICK